MSGEHRSDQLLLEYARRLGNGAVFKRLGYLIERMELDAAGVLAACTSTSLLASRSSIPRSKHGATSAPLESARERSARGARSAHVIGRVDLQDRAREWGLTEATVEKDYVLGWVLWGIGSEPQLTEAWAFKGGTCLKKCYLETYRFSEDLDFTVPPGGPIKRRGTRPAPPRPLARVHDQSGIDFSKTAPMFKTEPSGRYTEGRIYYTGPRGAPQAGRIKLDITAIGSCRAPDRPSHPSTTASPTPCLSRPGALLLVRGGLRREDPSHGRARQAARPYDIVNLYRRSDLRKEPHLVREVLTEKCRTKGIAVPT